MASGIGGGQQRSTEGAAFNAYQFANCEDTLTVGDNTIRISRKVAKAIIPLLKIREHEGEMFAHELKADEL